jgi:hypothetical protein
VKHQWRKTPVRVLGFEHASVGPEYKNRQAPPILRT